MLRLHPDTPDHVLSFELDGTVYGKPHEPAIARERWLAQRGRSGVLHSGHWLIDHRGGRVNGAVGRASRATVHFADDIETAEIDAYIASGEWRGKAGGYAIQGQAEALIQWMKGSHSGVMGLPLYETRALLKAAGFALG